jgi:hypothetical protein
MYDILSLIISTVLTTYMFPYAQKLMIRIAISIKKYINIWWLPTTLAQPDLICCH